jgi:exosortase/archaeosortase family protein
MRNSCKFDQWRKSYLGFLATFLSIAFLFYLFNIGYIAITAKGGFYSAFLDEHLNYIRWWRNFSIQTTADVLKRLGYEVYTNHIRLKVIGRYGFTLVYECLGYGIMSVFTAFVIAFDKPIKSKIYFLLIGLTLVQLLNIFRFILLSLYWKRNSTLFGFDHHTLFNFLIYVILIIAVYIWINYFNKNDTNATQKII